MYFFTFLSDEHSIDNDTNEFSKYIVQNIFSKINKILVGTIVSFPNFGRD